MKTREELTVQELNEYYVWLLEQKKEYGDELPDYHPIVKELEWLEARLDEVSRQELFEEWLEDRKYYKLKKGYNTNDNT